jgi:hypothetical protein
MPRSSTCRPELILGTRACPDRHPSGAQPVILDNHRVIAPPVRHPLSIPRPPTRLWVLLLGGAVGIPLVAFGIGALLSAATPCSSGGEVPVLLTSLAACAMAVGWPLACRARRWAMAGTVVVATTLGVVAGFAGWAWVGLDRCFTF